jgi:hypothetical protein
LDTVTIGRLHSVYRVPREEPDAGALRARLDRLAGRQVGDALTEIAQRLPVADVPGLVVVRRLELRLLLGFGHLVDERVTAVWARALAGALTRALTGPGGDLVARFRDWADYLASFLEEVAAGARPVRWRYEHLTRSGQPSDPMVVAAALREREAWIVPTLVELGARDTLGAVLRALGEPAAWSVFEALERGLDARPGPPAPAEECLDRLLGLLRDWPGLRRRAASSGEVALLLVAGSAGPAGGPPPPAVLAAIRRAATVVPDLWDASGQAAPSRFDRIGVAAAEALAVLDRDQPALAAVLRTPARQRQQVLEAASRLNVEELVTDAGGVLFLLSSLVELDLPGLLLATGVPAGEAEAVAPTGRWLILLKALGGRPRDWARNDPGLTMAAGLAAPPGRAELERLTAATAPVDARRLGRALRAWALRRGLLAGTVRTVTRRADLPSSAQAAITRAVPEGLWLLARLVEPAGAPSRRMLSGPPPPIGVQVAHLAAPELVPEPAADLLWTHLTAVTLHLFARRLPGFQRSSAPHLAANFLLGRSHLRVGPDGVVGDLPRVPLRLVIRLGGWEHVRADIPWLPGQRLVLDQEGS